ncbi:TPA: hypothetical protein N0F65_009211 [Lagenidium giganteum]|uniref:PiggyBac transposable element-derived protein domain-containing protein n=1 Tax=Lagenidium giganteum TaxID=4803 RepID=A0AAV2YS90_9STRA|nr:TPA: hypothetical protein N0F65_009211 [Lagenidium giganteum]
MPKALWREIAEESNRYLQQRWSYRLRNEMPFEPYEYVRLVGLMIARMMCPHRQKLSRHWSPVSEGAIPSGTFGRFMPQNRFNELTRNLHFTNNMDVLARTDRAWRVRSVVACKPHSNDCGKNQHRATALDYHAGEAAVLRNLKCVLPTVDDDWRVVTDLFYTPVQLAFNRHIYFAGRVMTNRLGLPNYVVETKTIKKNDRKRGDAVMVVAKQHSSMTMLSWMDSMPDCILSTCGNRKQSRYVSVTDAF